MFQARRVAGLSAVAAALFLAGACSGGSGKQPAASTTSTVGTTTTEPADALPNGFLAIPTPAGVDPEFFGQNVSVTTTANGSPVVAFSILFEDAIESQVVTATYDDTIHDFRPTVRVAGATLHGAAQSISITRDNPGRDLVVAWDDKDEVLFARSTDDGATWTAPATIANGHSPSVAAADGKVAIAFVDGNGLPAVATGDDTGAPFAITEVPNPPGGPAPRSESPAVAVTRDGAFGVAYFVTTNAGGAAAVYLPVGSTAPVVALASGATAPSDPPAVGLAFGPRGPVVGATLCRDACTRVAVSTDDGATFGPATVVPADGKDTGGRVTRVAVDDQGRGAFAYTPASDEPADATNQCGLPKIATSSDLATWSTCSPDPQNNMGLVPRAPALVLSPDSSLVIAFQQISPLAKAPTGVLVVIYPPLGSALISP